MALSIPSATIRVDEAIIEILLEDMTKEKFNEVKEHLFCPNIVCNARIEYASGPSRTFFRTKKTKVKEDEVIEQHMTDCPYSVEHSKSLGSRRKYDASILIGLSDKHKTNALQRAYKRYIDPSYGKRKPGSFGKKTKSKPSIINDELPSKGKASLRVPSDDEEISKEPTLFQRNIDDINESDYGQIRTVSGTIECVLLIESHKTIIIKTKSGRSARILFGEYFKVNNEVQYHQLDYYENYFNDMRANGSDVFVACIGEITKDDYDISIVMSNYRDIFIDNKGHYKVIRKYLEKGFI